MSGADRRVMPGGSRRANNRGSIVLRRLASGEARYQARYATEHLGTFDSRSEAERAIAAAQARARVTP